jgi:hypothetical protein
MSPGVKSSKSDMKAPVIQGQKARSAAGLTSLVPGEGSAPCSATFQIKSFGHEKSRKVTKSGAFFRVSDPFVAVTCL